MRVVTLFVYLVLGFSASSQHKNIELEDIWKYYRFYAAGVSGLESMKDGEHYTTLDRMKDGSAIVKYSYSTGEQISVLASESEMSEAAGKEVTIDGYQFSADETKLLVSSQSEPTYRHSSRS